MDAIATFGLVHGAGYEKAGMLGGLAAAELGLQALPLLADDLSQNVVELLADGTW